MPKTSTLNEAVQDYLYDKRNLRFRTLRWYTQKLGEFDKWCAQQEIDLEDVKGKTVNQFLEHKQSSVTGISDYTLRGYAQVVKGFMTWCTDSEEYEDDVKVRTVKKIELPKVAKSVVKIYTADEIKDLFNACSSELSPELVARDKALLAVLMDTGIRASEIAFDSARPDERTGLRMGEINIDRLDPHIRVTGKGNKEREIGLGQKSRSLLQRYIQRYRGKHEHDYVFVSRTGEPLSVRGLEMTVKRLAEAARVEEAYLHKFRHTFAVTYLLQSKDDKDGAALYKLMRLLGHTDIATTQIYLRALEARQARKGGSVLDNMG